MVDEPRIVELGLFGIDRFGVDTHLSISLGVHLSPEEIRCWECVNLGVKVSQHLIIIKTTKKTCFAIIILTTGEHTSTFFLKRDISVLLKVIKNLFKLKKNQYLSHLNLKFIITKIHFIKINQRVVLETTLLAWQFMHKQCLLPLWHDKSSPTRK